MLQFKQFENFANMPHLQALKRVWVRSFSVHCSRLPVFSVVFNLVYGCTLWLVVFPPFSLSYLFMFLSAGAPVYNNLGYLNH